MDRDCQIGTAQITKCIPDVQYKSASAWSAFNQTHKFQKDNVSRVSISCIKYKCKGLYSRERLAIFFECYWKFFLEII